MVDYKLFQAIKDYQLIGIISALSIGIICILVVWEIVAPQRLIRKELITEVSMLLGTGYPFWGIL